MLPYDGAARPGSVAPSLFDGILMARPPADGTTPVAANELCDCLSSKIPFDYAKAW